MAKLYITPTQVLERVHDITRLHGVTGATKIWGVPRGGVPVALALASATGASLVGSPEEADLVIDDIYDSGKTAARYWYAKAFDVLFDKRKAPWAGQWLVMPWEISEENDDSASDAITRLLQFIGESPEREGLRETPARVLKAWGEWCSGYNKKPEDILKLFEDGAESYDEMIFVGSTSFYSHCEHHLAPFFGVAHIGYIPNGKIIGLSKISRLLEVFTRRLQVQERATVDVANTLMEHLNPLGVGVVLQARHLCLESRGIQKIGSITTTSAIRGVIKDKPEVRAEFMSFVAAQGACSV